MIMDTIFRHIQNQNHGHGQVLDQDLVQNRDNYSHNHVHDHELVQNHNCRHDHVHYHELVEYHNLRHDQVRYHDHDQESHSHGCNHCTYEEHDQGSTQNYKHKDGHLAT